jgi:hypothetical protein
MSTKQLQQAEDGVDRGHQYAFDSDGNWVNAKKMIYKDYQLFYCGCPERHKMKLVKPSGLPEKRPFCDYFANIQSNPKRQKSLDKSERNVEMSHCSGGESWRHKMAKHTLRECVGSYYFTTFRCNSCSSEVVQDSVGCSVSMEIVSADKKWRYDCLLEKEGQAAVAMEVVYTHLTGSAKINSVRASGLEIAEFRADDVIDKVTMDGRTKLENIKIRTGMCDNCSMMTPYNSEILEWLKLENMITKEYENREEIKRRLREDMTKRQGKDKSSQNHRDLNQGNVQNGFKKDTSVSPIKVVKPTNPGRLNAAPNGVNSNSQPVYDPPKFIYKSVYHMPDGSPSWTPYEMIAERVE